MSREFSSILKISTLGIGNLLPRDIKKQGRIERSDSMRAGHVNGERKKRKRVKTFSLKTFYEKVTSKQI